MVKIDKNLKNNISKSNIKIKEYDFNKIFPWEEFYNRYTNNHEEFNFHYKGNLIHLITDWNGFLYNYGNYEDGFFTSKIYTTPFKLLQYARFNGKTLNEIWSDLE